MPPDHLMQPWCTECDVEMGGLFDDDLWPRLLAATDEQVAEVERWLADSSLEMPRVLRGEVNVGHLLTVARLAMRFGQVRRVTLHEDGEPESDTTHTVMLALVVIEVAPLVDCDPGLAVQFAAVHDLAEAYAGDTNTAHGLSPEQAEAKATREDAAIQRITAEIGAESPTGVDSPTLCLLRRYEAQQEPAARLVRYLDKVLPKLTHVLNNGSALRALGITAADVLVKHAQQGAHLAEQYPEMGEVRRLFDEACALVNEVVNSHAGNKSEETK